MTNLFLHTTGHVHHSFGELLLHALKDSFMDGLLSIPILFLAYLLMELLERSRKFNENILRGYSRRGGPAIGGILGIVPQCGISGAAASLFSTGAISVGTMLAVFFATSDEMLPILLSSLAEPGAPSIRTVVLIVAAKAGLGILLGYMADILLNRWIRSHKDIHSFCEREHCSCDDEEGNVFLSALKHTIKIFLMLFLVGFALNVLLEIIGTDRLTGSFLSKPFLGELALGLLGLIPNCSISVVITESYLNGLIGIGGLFSGLLSNAGIGLLVLWRTNKNFKENLAIMGVLFLFSTLAGMGITAIAMLL